MSFLSFWATVPGESGKGNGRKKKRHNQSGSRMAPFKPTEAGSTMRHIRKPKPQEDDFFFRHSSNIRKNSLRLEIL